MAQGHTMAIGGNTALDPFSRQGQLRARRGPSRSGTAHPRPWLNLQASLSKELVHKHRCRTGRLGGQEITPLTGYSRSAAKKHRQLVVHLSQWLELHDVAVCDLTATATEGFFGARRAHGTPNLRTPRSLDPLLTYLRGCGILAEPVPALPSDPVERFLDRYRRYLLEERGVAVGTAHFYVYIAGLFAAGRRCDGSLDWSALRAGEVTSFAACTCAGRSLSSARQVVSAMRNVLRFLAMEGLCCGRSGNLAFCDQQNSR